jgi:hypothetical protein
MKATSQIITEQNINFAPHALMRHLTTDSAAAEAISQSMAEGVTKTLDFASCFASQLGIKDFEGDCFKRGFHVELEDLGSNSKEIILRLVDLRRVVLHDTTSIGGSQGNAGKPTSGFGLLSRWDLEKLQVVAQFLYSYSIHYTLAIMDVVIRELLDEQKNGKSAKIARHKAAAELHVATLVLLKQKLWWLAWSLSDYVRVNYEGGDGLMLRLNAAFAQSKIGKPEDWRNGALDIKVSKKAAPRYQLLKRCILGEWNGIAPLIIKAVTMGDMTLTELATWPALDLLRNREEYNKAINRFGKM